MKSRSLNSRLACGLGQQAYSWAEVDTEDIRTKAVKAKLIADLDLRIDPAPGMCLAFTSAVVMAMFETMSVPGGAQDDRSPVLISVTSRRIASQIGTLCRRSFATGHLDRIVGLRQPLAKVTGMGLAPQKHLSPSSCPGSQTSE